MQHLTLTADPSLLTELAAKPIKDLRLGDPVPLDSELDALDSPIGIDEVRAAADVVTVVATSGVALLAFVEKVIEMVKSRDSRAELTTEDGKAIHIDSDSEAENIIRQIDVAEQ